MSSDENKPLDEETKQLIVEGYRKTNQKLGFDPAHEAEKQELKEKIEDLSKQLVISNYEKQKSKAEHDGYPLPAPKGGTTSPLNPPTDDYKPSNNNDSLMTKTYPNEFMLYSDLAKRSSEGDVEAKAIQRQLLKKLRQDCGGLIDVEFYGQSKALYRQPKPITPDMNEFQRQAVKEYNEKLMLEKSKWRRVQ